MAEKATFRFSAAAAAYLAAGVPKEKRLAGASGAGELPPLERLHLMVYLGNDPDPEVRGCARETLRTLDDAFLREVLAEPELHPRVLDILAKFHGDRTPLLALFMEHPNLSAEGEKALVARLGPPPSADADSPPAEEEETEEEFQSKYQLSQGMGISEKIKMALTGDKEWRSLLIKDSNKLVSGAVVKNPRLTENEVLGIAKSAVQNDEIMRTICANKEWVKNYQIRKALVENHKTPLPVALRFMTTLSEKDLASLAKSKNVSSVVSGQARRILMSKS